MTLTSLIKRASAAAGVSVLLASAAIGYRYIALDQPIALATPSVSDFSAAARYVFIPSKDSSLVEVLDRDKDEIVGRLNPGLIPTLLVVSEAARRLAVSDTNRPSIALIDLANGRTTNIDLPSAPDRLIGSPDGYVVAAIAAKSGNIAIVDMLRGRVV